MPFMKDKKIDLTIPVILTNGEDYTIDILQGEGEAQLGTMVMKILKK